MERQRTIPRLGILLALLTAGALLASGLEWPTVGAITLVWLGSLWLSTAKPPETSRRDAPSPFSKENLRTILELSASPLLLTEKGKVTIANRAAREVIGVHTIGQDARIAFRNPDAIVLLNSRGGGSCTVRNLNQLRDCWEMRRQVIDDRLAIIELTDRTAEEALSRAHTDFVANASHELRTPLSSIIGYTETLRDLDPSSLPPGMADKFLATIQREAKRLQELVGDLMSLSRIEAEKHDAPATPVMLSEIVRRGAEDAAGAARASRIDFLLDEGVAVPGDQQQLEQVVRNLVDNALKYGDEGEQVRVSLKRVNGRFARLTVTDKGAGIAKEHIPYLTRRFYRTDPGRSRLSGGTGLGLAIVKHAVERHRGRLDINSTLGQGTRVVVRLPLYDREQALEEELVDDAQLSAQKQS